MRRKKALFKIPPACRPGAAQRKPQKREKQVDPAACRRFRRQVGLASGAVLHARKQVRFAEARCPASFGAAYERATFAGRRPMTVNNHLRKETGRAPSNTSGLASADSEKSS